MTTSDPLAGRIRAARPPIEGQAPPLVYVLAAIQRDRERTRWWRRRIAGRRTGLLALAGMALAGGVAWAATTLLRGPSVTPAYVVAKPGLAQGVPIARTVTLLPIRTADPAGGPPWAMRVFRTTRGLSCMQIGRLVDRQLGVLGIGFAFNHDGRFHPLTLQDAYGPPGSGIGCQPPDSNGNIFSARTPWIESADGLSLVWNTLERVSCDMPGDNSGVIRCPPADLREIAYGLLGPDTTSITVATTSHTFTIKPYGRDGAYLVVLPAPADGNVGSYHALGHAPPDAPTLTAHFNNGATCRLGQTCPPVGIHYPPASPPTEQQIATPIHVRYRRHAPATPATPLLTGNAAGNGSLSLSAPQPGDQGAARLTIAFRARIAVTSPKSLYDFQITRPVVPGCLGNYVVGNGTNETIATGALVRFEIPLKSGCHGTYHGRVIYVSVAPNLDVPPDIVATNPFAGALPKHAGTPAGITVLTVGTFTTTIP